MMRKVQVYLSMNDVEKAAGVMRELIAQDPRNGRYYKDLGDLYDNNKMPEKAADVCVWRRGVDSSFAGEVWRLKWGQRSGVAMAESPKLKDAERIRLCDTKVETSSPGS